MNLLDENIPASQRSLLRSMRIALRQIGEDLGRKGKGVYMAEPSPDIANRVAVMRDMAEAAQERGEVFFYIRIPEPLGPFERGDKYEDPLTQALASADLGRVTGGGQQLGEGDSIEYSGVDVVVRHRMRGLKLLRKILKQLAAPAGTVIEEFIPEFQEHPLQLPGRRTSRSP
jgi:hypothetical protein